MLSGDITTISVWLSSLNALFTNKRVSINQVAPSSFANEPECAQCDTHAQFYLCGFWLYSTRPRPFFWILPELLRSVRTLSRIPFIKALLFSEL